NDGPNTAAEIVFANAEANVIDISRFVQTGTQIDSLIVADDEGHAQVFSITAGNDEGIFRIDSLSGSITIADEALLLGSAATFLLTILSEDQGPGDITSEISLTVNVIDNAPPVVTDTIVFIDENSSDDTFVAAFEFSDPDGDFLFPLDGTITPEGILDLSEGGVITVQNGSLLDFETNPSIEVTYTIGDGGPLNLETTGTIIVNLNDVNEAPEVAAADFNISQFSPNGFEVGNVEFTDQDNGQEHTFAITTGNDEGIFTINDTTGLLTISDNSNLTATDYELTVEVADNGAPILARSASVSISAFSNEPPVITAETFSVEENANSGTAFGQLTFSDPDGDLVDLSIIDGNELGVFEIDGSGDIQVLDSTSLDFETNPTFELVVQAQDNGIGTLTSTATIVINLLDVNEAPSVESESFDISSSIATGDLIGQVEAEDPDIDVLTYSLTTGNDQGIFAINETTGVLSIADASLLDPATVPQHELTVEVTDGELSDSTEFIINVFLNNAPLLNTLSFTIDENNSPEATI
ncbi:MAG: cadherin repeat domain-containing protein, partial [Bacteroidota bacterium]